MNADLIPIATVSNRLLDLQVVLVACFTIFKSIEYGLLVV